MERGKPRIAFVPVAMKLFWQLYPDLEQRCRVQQNIVYSHLNEECEVCDMPLTGDEGDADNTISFLKENRFDLIVIWEHGYVASAIPFKIIKEFPDTPNILLITQKDKEIPVDMDYARYMESTATTSAMELGGVLKRMGYEYSTIAGHMDEKSIYESVYSMALAARVWSEFKNLKVGSIGYGYPGMLDICVDDSEVTKLGPGVRKITLEEVRIALDGIIKEKIAEFKTLSSMKFNMERVKEDDFVRSAKTYLALEEIILKNGISALCVHDYDFLSTVTGAVSDFALSMLENKYFLATGVEGDMPNTLSAFIGSRLSGQSCMFVDWTMFDEKLNAIFLQHNGKADPDIVDNPSLSPSAEPFGGVIGDGVVVEAAGKSGPVTMISMIYRDGWHIYSAQGQAITQSVRPCRLNQITVQLISPVKSFIESACNQGVGHHLNVAQGHWNRELKALARLLKISYTELE